MIQPRPLGTGEFVMRKIAILSLLSLAVSSQALTIATHDDPALGPSTPLFTVTASSVSGSWTGTGLTLEIPAVAATLTNMNMSMSAVTRAGGNLGAGVVKFYSTNIAAPEFQVNFASGSIFEPFGFGGSFISGNNVTFSGSAISSLGAMSNQQFAFSFANPVIGTNGNTYTASFTSSADVVPEPMTMLAVAGLAAVAARRRNRS